MKKLSSFILALVLLASLTIPALAQTTVKLGYVGEALSVPWQPVIEKLAAEGVTLKLIPFTDYPQPNRALAEKEIDLNSFQHYAFLNKEIANFGYELTVIGDTLIAPLGLYSRKIKSVSEIKDGDKIAIPSDATNGGRAIKLLETAGLLKVDPAAGFVPEKADITEYVVKVDIIEVEAALTASLLPDVIASIINGAHAVDNGFVPANDAIFLEQAGGTTNNPYVNVLVARTEDKDNPLYLKILEYYHSPEVAEILATDLKGAFIPAWDVNAK